MYINVHYSNKVSLKYGICQQSHNNNNVVVVDVDGGDDDNDDDEKGEEEDSGDGGGSGDSDGGGDDNDNDSNDDRKVDDNDVTIDLWSCVSLHYMDLCPHSINFFQNTNPICTYLLNFLSYCYCTLLCRLLLPLQF